MKLWTQAELARLHRSDLLELFRVIASQLPALSQGSTEHREALETLANIRAMLRRPMPVHGRGGWRPPAP